MQYKASDFTQSSEKTPYKASDFTASAPSQQSTQTQQFKASDFGNTPTTPQVPTHLPGLLQPNVQAEIDQAAKQRGIPVWALRAIARQETGGLPHPETQASPAGAQGVMQMLPATFKGVSPKGNIFNLKDNVQAGATYYQTLLKKYGDPIKAAGAYNVGPGAFDDYLAGKRALPAETIAYMANVAAMHTPIDDSPLPPFHVSHNPNLPQKRLPTQARTNLDPEKARYEWFDQVFGHQDLPFILDNAALADQLLPGAGHMQKALHLYAKNPAAAAAEYGDNARQMLLLQAELGDEQIKNEPILAAKREAARFMLAHPAAAAGATALEEFFNPMSWIEGAGVGKALGGGARLLNASRIGRQLLHFASPYREIVAQHGESARNALWQMGARIAQADKAGRAALKPLENLTQAEQWEVGRLSQVHNVKHTIPNPAMASKYPDLMKRALALRAQIKTLTDAKLAAKVITPEQAKDVNFFLPTRGLHEDQMYNDETMSFLDALRPNVQMARGAVAESLKRQKFDTLDEAISAGSLDPTKVNLAKKIYQFTTASHQNIAFENGLREIAAKFPNLIRFDSWENYKGLPAKPWAQNAFDDEQTVLHRVIAENQKKYPVGHPQRYVRTPPLDKWGRQMVRFADKFNTPSPGLNNAWVSRELAELFERGKGPGKITGWSDDEAIRGMSNLVQRLNQAQRAFIVTNPGFHPFWNIASNTSSGTNAGLFETMRNYGRAVVGTAFSVADFAKLLPGAAGQTSKAVLEAAEKQFWVGSQQYAHDLADAVAAGAEAHFGPGMKSALGGDAIRLRTLAKSELIGPEKLDRFLADLTDWNSHATFGPRGEGQFVATFFKNRKARGLADADAAWQTREALGHYQNVDPNSWQSKWIMFYPWLKSNVPHYLLNFLQNPKLARSQIESFHRYNEEAGDPKISDPLNRRNPAQLYLGRDNQGRETTYTPPLPWKDAEKVGEIIAPGPRDLNERLQVGEELIASRLKVLPSIGVNTFGTMIGQPGERGQYQGFDTMYNKNDPGIEQVKQEALSVIERSGLYPAPFLVQDFIDKGFEADRLRDYISELTGAGMIARTDGTQKKGLLKKLLFGYRKNIGKLYKRQQGSDPLPQEDFDARKKFFTDQYNARVKRIQDALAAQMQKKTTQKHYATSDFTVPTVYKASDFK